MKFYNRNNLTDNYFFDTIKKIKKINKGESMKRKMLEFKLWGGCRDEENAVYIWAYDMDDAIVIARKIDLSICIAQWTGKERII